MIKNNIFIRIYAGLLVLVVLIALVCYFLVQIINYYRVQAYREALTDGISYVVSERLSHLNNEQKEGWLSDASYVIGFPLYFIRHEEANLSYGEKKRIENDKAVVRYDVQDGAQIILSVKDKPYHYLSVPIKEIGERQLKALAIFIVDYLSEYPNQEQQKIEEIRPHFSYDLQVREVNELNLDAEQLGRLKRDKSLLLYRDNTTAHRGTISVISWLPNQPSKVMILGEIAIYSAMPLQLAGFITLLAMILLSLGVYGLIVPLERRVHQVTGALDKMQKGDLSIRLNVTGEDEMATLAHSYDRMVEHIQRLILAQQELMRAVSHELRTPVARIRFAVQMLEDEDDIDARHFQAGLIDKDIEELNKLIDEIMTYAKLEQGTPSFEFEQIVLHDLLEQVGNETQALKTGKILELDLPSPELLVQAEYRYLHRVVQNLVGNAVRYAESKVRISGGILADGQAYVCVEDDGAGIPEEQRQRIFEAFARLDDSRTRASGGYGLGLSIVARIAYWFGGSVMVDESPNLGGARFTMKWSIEQAKKMQGNS